MWAHDAHSTDATSTVKICRKNQSQLANDFWIFGQPFWGYTLAIRPMHNTLSADSGAAEWPPSSTTAPTTIPMLISIFNPFENRRISSSDYLERNLFGATCVARPPRDVCVLRIHGRRFRVWLHIFAMNFLSILGGHVCVCVRECMGKFVVCSGPSRKYITFAYNVVVHNKKYKIKFHIFRIEWTIQNVEAAAEAVAATNSVVVQ